MSDTQFHDHRSLAAYRHCLDRMATEWPRFLDVRADRLRHGEESEKVAESILEDVLTGVLDWAKGDLLYQVGYADIVLSHNLQKYLLIEVKRPGWFRPVRRTFEDALNQAQRYAAVQKVPMVAASDGRYLYAADVTHGGLCDRVLVDLAAPEPPQALWWLSLNGIYRACIDTVAWPDGRETVAANSQLPASPCILHHKYALPANCFAYVGDANDTHTWKLPFRLADGTVDESRLPKAIQALLMNYRGAKVGGIPDQHLPDVLRRLAEAARSLGRMPPDAVNPAPSYRQLATALDQLDAVRK
jgi:hypothetical protein